jgi:sugar lactone lactonase YvrE
VVALVVIIVIGAFTAAHARADVLYAANYGNNTVEQFTSAGAGSTRIGSAGQLVTPTALAFDAAGNLYVASTNSSSIRKYAPGDSVGTFFGPHDGSLGAPTGLAFDASGNLFVASGGFDSIEKITPAGVSSVFARNGVLVNPYALAFDASGNLYVADNGDNSIERFTPAGVPSLVANASAGLSDPTALAFDAAGNLYVANHNNNAIIKLTPGGSASPFATIAFDPEGLAFDSTGDLYVASSGNNVIDRITPDGAGSPIVYHPPPVPQSVPRGLAFTTDSGVPLALPVPEPATLLTLAAFAGPALLLRRPRRAA